MITPLRLAGHNALIRRLRQHGAMTTLFRTYAPEGQTGLGQRRELILGNALAPLTLEAAPEIASTAAEPQEPLSFGAVSASPNDTAAMNTPMVQRTPTASVGIGHSRAMPPSVTPNVVPIVPATVQSLLSPSTSPATMPASGTVPAPPNDPASLTEAEPAAEPHWTRLQTIMRRHEEIRRANDQQEPLARPTPNPNAPSETPPAGYSNVSPAPQPTGLAPAGDESPALAAFAPRRRPLQRAGQAEAASQNVLHQKLSPQTTQTPVAPQPVAEQQPEQPTPLATASIQRAVAAPSTGAPKASPVEAPQIRSFAQPDEQTTQLLAASEVHGERAPMAVTSPVASLVAPTESRGDGPGEKLADNDDDARADTSVTSPATAHQALPLEAVWAVQRANEPSLADVRDAKLRPSTASPTAVTVLPSAVESALAETVRQRLETIETGRPTESKVDVIAPRRPPPVRQPRTPTMTSDQPPSAAPVQRQAQDAPPARTPSHAAPGLIDTAIGPLPADLWQLLDETPPATTAPSAADAAVDAAPATAQGTATDSREMAMTSPFTGVAAPSVPVAGALPGEGDATLGEGPRVAPPAGLPSFAAQAVPTVETHIQQAQWPGQTLVQRQLHSGQADTKPNTAAEGSNADLLDNAQNELPIELKQSLAVRGEISDAALGIEIPLHQTTQPPVSARQHFATAPLSMLDATPGEVENDKANIVAQGEPPTLPANGLQSAPDIQRAPEIPTGLAADPVLEQAQVEAERQPISPDSVAATQTAKPGKKKASQRDEQQAGRTLVSLAASLQPEGQTTPAGPTVQRQPAEVTSPVADTAGQPPAAKQAQTTGQAELKVDMDELARQVYKQVKRKLAVERERLR